MQRPRSKYGNKKTEIDGITFDSAKEARRYSELRLLERAGEISDLECHPVYPIEINGKRICKVVPDFGYLEDGRRVVEDVKSPITRKNREYRLKKKLVEAVHGIEVVEI
ncbi:MAG: DUF1064 domain-containing protein [Pseudomonadota bacterium]|nr:DUF1064 domain-containing protein [Pseudomonadota bacterium]